VTAAARVIVLGQTAADKLFGPGVSPLGRSLRLRGASFQVIGVLERKGQSPMGSDYDDVAIVPFTAFQTKIQGGLQKFVAGAILISATSPTTTTRAQRQIAAILRDRHHLASDTEDDFSVRNLTEIASAQQQGTKALTGLLAAIAVVSLVVGGIGIMNIMLVSVTERTREIGIRIAVGAQASAIKLQFLIEAIVLSLFGGLAGVLLGVGASRLVGAFAAFTPVVTWGSIALAFGVSFAIGVFFGYYPAKRASDMDPIEALRYE
jgi:putative ABC transport system permease protein